MDGDHNSIMVSFSSLHRIMNDNFAECFIIPFYLLSYLKLCVQGPKVQQKTKEQKMAAAMAGARSKKKVRRHSIDHTVVIVVCFMSRSGIRVR